jgi:CRISPR system Cascade subunit CasE
MYLSRCILDGRAAVNPYDVHRHLWDLLSSQPEADRPFLYRVENNGGPSAVNLLLQSQVPPANESRHVRVLGTKPMEIRVREGTALRFLLCANPIKRLSEARCRVPLIRDEDLTAWLARKMDGACLLETAAVEGKKNVYFRKKGMAGKLVTVTYAGILKVRDSQGLSALVRSGIGPAKSFGCGLLSLARA